MPLTMTTGLVLISFITPQALSVGLVDFIESESRRVDECLMQVRCVW